MIQDLKDRISERKTELNDELRTTQDNKLIAQTKLNSTIELIETSSKRFEELRTKTDWEDDIQRYQEQINKHQEKLSELNNSLEKYKEELEDTTNKTLELENKKLHEISTIDKSYADVLANIQEEVNKSEVELRVSHAELNRVINITDICPTCGQKLPDVHKPNVEKYQQDYDNAKAKNSEIKNHLKVTQDEISKRNLQLQNLLKMKY
jgi:DNA repair exonuclease SbcCD ATPase subunit